MPMAEPALLDLRTATATATPRWAALAGPGDLVCTPRWLEVERSGAGPWVPVSAGCLFDPAVPAGLTVQLFDAGVDDEIVRVDKMAATARPGLAAAGADAARDALLPAPVCGGWFNSRVLVSAGAGPAVALAARRRLVEAALRVADSEGAHSVAFPYLDHADHDLRGVLRSAGFIELAAPARHVLDTRAESFEDHLGRLRSHRRTRIRAELRRVAEAGVRTGEAVLDGSTVEWAARLAHQLEVRYGQRCTYEQIAEWFEQIGRHTGTVLFTGVRDGVPIAMSLWIRHQDRLYGFHAGFDDERCVGLPLYSVVGYHLPVAHGCADPGLATLEYGIGSDEAKALRGTRAEPQVLALLPRSGAARDLLDRTASVF